MPVPSNLDPGGLDRMLADGVGDITWMRENREVRLDPRSLLPGCVSILAVTLNYQPENRESQGANALLRSRYAAGKDYHRLLRRKLSAIGRKLAPSDGRQYQSRALVDSAPLLERTLAHKAGLGWIGKNGLLVTPKKGSYQFLGFLLTDAPLEERRAGLEADRCGKCAACREACPTSALVDRRVLSERCISYFTVEHKGIVPAGYAGLFQGWWYGCDICQEACPWNRFAPGASDARLEGRDNEQELLKLGPESFDKYFEGRVVRRIGYERFRRNLLVALWSLGRIEECRQILEGESPLVSAQAAELGLV
jgi:epoxyqueuosine reductase